MTTQQPTLDSREVAEMVEKQHGHLMRDIAKYVSVIDKPNQSKSGLVEDDYSGLKFEPVKSEDSSAPKIGGGSRNALLASPILDRPKTIQTMKKVSVYSLENHWNISFQAFMQTRKVRIVPVIYVPKRDVI